MSRKKTTVQEKIQNKIQEYVDDYDKREELMDEVKHIRAKRVQSARTASKRILGNIHKLQSAGLQTKIDFKTT